MAIFDHIRLACILWRAERNKTCTQFYFGPPKSCRVHFSLQSTIYRPLKTCVTLTDLSRSLKVKDNGAMWNLIYDFLSIFNSNSVVILNRYGDIGHWKPVLPGLIFQGHSWSKKTSLNETSHMTSYMWIIYILIANSGTNDTFPAHLQL